MQHAEVIYESGDKSVVEASDLDTLKAGLAEHHRRALAGEDAGPVGGPASRIKRVIIYPEHPVDMHTDRVSLDSLNTLITGMADEKNTVDSQQLIRAIRDEVSPVYPMDQGRHSSDYKADGEELDLSFLDNSNTDGDV